MVGNALIETVIVGVRGNVNGIEVYIDIGLNKIDVRREVDYFCFTAAAYSGKSCYITAMLIWGHFSFTGIPSFTS